jgi:hypothetical protein
MLPASLIDLVERQSAQSISPPLEALRDALLARYGDAVRAMLFYGSCLRSGDALDGLVDLYVVADDYRAAYGRWLPSFFNALLPPNVYYLEVPFGDTKVRCKYAVLSLADLRRGTSTRWFHSYLWGRFAQPSGIAYARDAEAAKEVNEAFARAIVTFITRALPSAPERFNAGELWRAGLELSYRSELRTESAGRAAELVATYRDNYERLTAAAMPAAPYHVEMEPGGTVIRYRARISSRRRFWNRMSWWLRRVQGKLLSVLRLMKSVFTFAGGVDYIAWKLERHTGVPVRVTPQMRRYPLIFVWAELVRLYRLGVFR